MDHAPIKIGAAVVLAPPFSPALPTLSPTTIIPCCLLRLAMRRNAEVWHDLRPDVTPPAAAVGRTDEAPKEDVQPERKEEGSRSGDGEEREMKEDGLNVPQ